MKRIVSKKGLALLVAALLVFALLPGAALADGEVAQVGNNQYTSVQAAINAVKSDTVSGDIVLIADVTESVKFEAGTYTLDLNNKTLTGGATDAIYVAKDATLTVKGSGTVKAGAKGYAAVFNNGTTVLAGGLYTRSSGANWYTIVNHGVKMTIEEGVTVDTQTDETSSLVENGYSSYSGSNERVNYVPNTNVAAPKMIINGGAFSAAGYNAVKNDEGGVLEIHGGTFTSKRADGAVIMNWNEAEITGGTFTATQNNTAVLANGTWGDNAKGVATITGGTFIVDESAEGATLIWYGQGSGTGGTLEVSNAVFEGTFNEKVTDIYAVDITSCSSTNPVPSNLVADGKGEIGLDGKYHVGTTEYLLEHVAATAEMGSTIDVVVGSFELNNVSDGVTVKNSGSGTVSVNGEPVAPGEEVTVESELLYSIVKQPTDSIVTEGDAATFTVVAEGRDVMLGYQWRKSTDGGKTFKVIDGANAASYTTSATTLQNDGYQYDCIVFDANWQTVRANNAPSLTDADIKDMTEGQDYLRSKVVTLHVKEAGAEEPEPGEPVVPPTGDSPLLYAAIGAAVLCLLGLCLPALRKNRG